MDQTKKDESLETIDGLPPISPEVRKYLMSLLVETGADNLPGDVIAELIADLYERFADYLMVNIAKAMPEDKFYQFEKLLSSNADQKEIESFIKENVDYSKIMQETFSEFHDIYVGKQSK